jgi:hypothetical protein
MFETVILGGGAAGTGPLVWAARHGLLSDWLDAGIAIVDARRTLGGTIGRYALNADTAGGTFLECLSTPSSTLAPLRSDPATLALEPWRDFLPPMPLVGQFLQRLGEIMTAEVRQHPRSRFFSGARCRALRLARDNTVQAELELAGGERIALRARSAVIALGGHPVSWRQAQPAPGTALGYWRHRILCSDALLRQGGVAEAVRRLSQARDLPRAVVLGGSHSAFSAVWVLLERLPGVRFGRGGITVLYRRPPRLFYPSRAAAIADGYSFTEADVCPATGRVHRLGGLRGDGREIWRRLRGMPGTAPEPRVAAHSLHELSARDLRSLLDAADIIIPAFGYRLASVPIFAPSGSPIPLAAAGPSVGPDSRMLTAHGTPLPRVFGIGLGSGFRPYGAMAGEPSFDGQQNSLWLYQNGLGALIHEGVRAAV